MNELNVREQMLIVGFLELALSRQKENKIRASHNNWSYRMYTNSVTEIENTLIKFKTIYNIPTLENKLNFKREYECEWISETDK